jgi:hypothetical protein
MNVIGKFWKHIFNEKNKNKLGGLSNNNIKNESTSVNDIENNVRTVAYMEQDLIKCILNTNMLDV